MKTTRVRFKNDGLATEKQVAYARSLLAAVKGKVSCEDSEAVRGFLNCAELPADLTKWEASGLITQLKLAWPEYVVGAAISAIEQRTAGAKIYDTQSVFSLLALVESCQYLAQQLEAVE